MLESSVGVEHAGQEENAFPVLWSGLSDRAGVAVDLAWVGVWFFILGRLVGRGWSCGGGGVPRWESVAPSVAVGGAGVVVAGVVAGVTVECPSGWSWSCLWSPLSSSGRWVGMLV